MTLFPYKIIDLTHTLAPNIPAWDIDCGFKHTTKLDYDDCDTEVKFRVQQIQMDAGIGTHIDAPAHCIQGGMTIDQIPLQMLGVPCAVIDVSEHMNERYRVSVADIQAFEAQHGTIPEGTLVLIRTGWEQFWQHPEKYRNDLLFPSVSREAAELLLNRQVVGLGIDTLSPDCPVNGYTVHQLFLGAGKYLIENVAHLAHLPPTGSFVLALPIKIKEGTEAPVRLVALIDAQDNYECKNRQLL